MFIPRFCLLQNHPILLFFLQFPRKFCPQYYLNFPINFYNSCSLLVLDSIRLPPIHPNQHNKPSFIINHRIIIIIHIHLKHCILFIGPDFHFINFNSDCIH